MASRNIGNDDDQWPLIVFMKNQNVKTSFWSAFWGFIFGTHPLKDPNGWHFTLSNLCILVLRDWRQITTVWTLHWYFSNINIFFDFHFLQFQELVLLFLKIVVSGLYRLLLASKKMDDVHLQLKRTACIIEGRSIRAEELKSTLGWPSLQVRRNYLKCVLVHRCLHGIAPSYLLIVFSRHAQLFHGYITRSRDLLHPPFAKTTKYQGTENH